MYDVRELLSHFKEAKLLERYDVGDIEFSRSTYLAQVIDKRSGENFWPFIQLGDNYCVIDCFCSCEGGEPCCEHIALVLNFIYRGLGEPLHERFTTSFWYAITELYSKRVGYGVEVLKKVSLGHYEHVSNTGKKLFVVKSKEQYLIDVIEHRQLENEENSIKFSNLSQEELVRWREGNPSSTMCYELSFWSDIAKWLMTMQENNVEYTLIFGYDDEGIPNELIIQFYAVFLEFYLPRVILPEIIPSLMTVSSPLKVYNYEDQAIERITYSPEEYCFRVIAKDFVASETSKHHGYMLGSWYFVPNDGFYFQEQHLLVNTPIIGRDDIGAVLDMHHDIIAKFLADTKIEPYALQLSYNLFFDGQWALHIEPFLFDKGDLQRPYSGRFGNWVYIDNKGFYKVKGWVFGTDDKIVPRDKVSDFVSQYRFWLNSQHGFNINLSKIETKLGYRLSGVGALFFYSYIDIDSDLVDCMEFDDWVYIADHGFHAKKVARADWPIFGGMVIEEDNVSTFIQEYQRELEQLPSFFLKECPLDNAGVSIKFSGDVIVVKPHYHLKRGYDEQQFRSFGRYVYCGGFFEMPREMRIPARFSDRVIVFDIDNFIEVDLPVLYRYALEIDNCLKMPQEQCLVVKDIVNDRGNISLKLFYETDVGEINVVDIWGSVDKYFFSSAGLIRINSSEWDWLENLLKEPSKGFLNLSMLEFLRLDAIKELFPLDDGSEKAARVKEILDKLRRMEVDDQCNLDLLKCSLWPYQIKGLHWLWFLYCNGLSGILCDDMGLGKTHQAMGLLAAAQYKMQKKRCYLVVCPTSVLYHWQDKMEQYLPDVKVFTYYGPERNINDFDGVGLFLTSYGICRIDKEAIAKINFDIAFFDEIQMAKNHHSQIHRALKGLSANMCLGMTGTPIENYLQELKALFDLIMPEYMPSMEKYKEMFVTPIEKYQDNNRKKLLKQYVKPFLLRRKKVEVLTELPPKTEEIAHCQMLPQQTHLYKDLLERSRQEIMLKLEGDNIPYMHVFALLTKLKQICNHPALYLQKTQHYDNYQSGKWQLFVELLSEARASQQKVVVFSQFLGMLDIIEDYLKKMGINYAAIRGATTKRREQLRKFHDDPSCEVFVGSLGAIGLGVDLTAASVVIHYDRWWNAARENQATDRVHRLGQQRGVQVFKLVTRDTIEEKIHSLIASKGQLMEEIVAADDHNEIKRLSKEEIIEILTLS